MRWRGREREGRAVLVLFKRQQKCLHFCICKHLTGIIAQKLDCLDFRKPYKNVSEIYLAVLNASSALFLLNIKAKNVSLHD